MPKVKAVFKNQDGTTLAGLLELPEQTPVAFALFAHCFTCSKDIAAASRIARALVLRGIAVLRFDFTGLGNSNGDYSNTNFSSNIDDLIAAARYLETHYIAPALLIGHSLGGAAILAASHSIIMSARALVTIGAPARAAHVSHLLDTKRNEIESRGEAAVNLGGREFTIKKQFLEDVETYSSTEHIGNLKKALLVCHSPVDEIVPVSEAALIYEAAKHPKSFISLDRADHLLSRREDSEYLATVITAWATHYLDTIQGKAGRASDEAQKVEAGEVAVTEQDDKFTRHIFTESHQLIADEPVANGGRNLGPNPYGYLLAGLGACTSMTIRMYANRKQIPLKAVTVTLGHSRVHSDDCRDCESTGGMLDRITKDIRLTGDLSPAERATLMRIADRCPVHKTLHSDILIESRLLD